MTKGLSFLKVLVTKLIKSKVLSSESLELAVVLDEKKEPSASGKTL